MLRRVWRIFRIFPKLGNCSRARWSPFRKVSCSLRLWRGANFARVRCAAQFYALIDIHSRSGREIRGMRFAGCRRATILHTQTPILVYQFSQLSLSSRVMFLDRITIFVKGGDGGDGCMSFRHEFKVPRGGPNGGDGGNGGSVVVVAEENVDSLAALAGRKHWLAGSGRPGQGSNWTGKQGDDVVILVPPGTIVRDADQQTVLRDLTRPGDSIV